MLDYAALAAVAAVVREGSFERAALKLGITPSAVSQRVRGFEDRLGSALIVRGTPCVATATGQTLCAHFDQVELLEADLSPTLTPDRGTRTASTVKVAVNADSLATWFPRAAASFAKSTGMLLGLTLDDETNTAERLRAGEVFAAVTSDAEAVHGCRTFPLGRLRYAACASPEYRERYFKNGINGTALSQAPYMRFDRKDQLQARWAKEAHGANLNGPVHWVPSALGFLDFALAGLGWGLQPLALAQSHIAAGRLVDLSPDKPFEVELYWNVVRLHASSLRVLTDVVRKVASEELGS